MEEIKIWNYIIKWGIAQNPNLPSDHEGWSDENFTALKATLKNCLPYIRYFQISAKDVANYVFPYSQILEKKLWEDLNKSHLLPGHEITSTILPPRIILKSDLPSRSTENFWFKWKTGLGHYKRTESFSTVINEEHAAGIASWIDKNTIEYNVKNNPYKFKLLLRGSRDGFNRESFWKLCNKKANTVTVINVTGNDNIERIFGGYNPVEWDNSKNGSYGRCKDSFIFSLKKDAIQNSILSRVKKPAYAIYNNTYRGINFGGCSLAMFYNNNSQINGCYTYHNNDYEKQIDIGSPNTKKHYFVNEYEVFQVHKKS
ncbi:TLD-domain-containing protein [Gigaspora rosea]|uniref:TLD-domain-containing protein n=1 Tax=Gigaspora rosea TaxID=44941 RepID=A0A397V6M1_9GLOM|nr:TLD-domain-containing protein [Gigaspora rosea]